MSSWVSFSLMSEVVKIEIDMPLCSILYALLILSSSLPAKSEN